MRIDLKTLLQQQPQALHTATYDPLAEIGSGSETVPDQAPRAPSSPGGEWPGDRYEKLVEIGRGGMGTVCLTLDRSLRRKVALKTLRSEDSPKRRQIQRFVDEAQITGQLDHPNIVPIHELGREENGSYFFTMKWVQGKTLESLIDEEGDRRLEPDRLMNLLRVLTKACEAVAFAHSRGVIHRDLKPANIMVGEFGQVYIMDWGVAKIFSPEGAPVSKVTLGSIVERQELDTSGTVVGTPAYMAPEQVEGQHDSVGPRTDVFALGATLYHILTGQAPYRGPNYYAILMEALSCRPASPEELVADSALPAELVRITRQAMAPVPEERFVSVSQFQERIERFLRGTWNHPVEVFAPGTTIVAEGDDGDTAYILIKGHCLVLKRTGDQQVEVRRLGPGDVFGEMAVISSTPRTATVKAIDEVSVLVVTGDSLTAGLGLNSWMGSFVKALAERFREVDERLRAFETPRDH